MGSEGSTKVEKGVANQTLRTSWPPSALWGHGMKIVKVVGFAFMMWLSNEASYDFLLCVVHAHECANVKIALKISKSTISGGVR